jgi:hypothetical protein
MFTLPILEHDAVAKVVKKRRYGIRRVLEESGGEWTSLEFWYWGAGPTRGECRATVLIGIPETEGEEWMWWGEGGIVERIKEKVKGKMEVEVCWREVRKCEGGGGEDMRIGLEKRLSMT